MAIKHRKLFPPATNETTDCLGFCDPACPNNCNPYDDPVIIPPPLLPPPPPSSGKSQAFSPYLIVLVGFLAASFVLVSYYVVIVKFCSGWNPVRRRRTTQRSQPPDEDDQFIDQSQRPVIDHPIWYINTIGLQQSVINSISVFNYKKGDFLIEGKECMVCLGEFQEEDRLRLLPKCSHAFHIHCIDTWLRSHTNCPLCRAPIVSNTAVSPPTNNNSSDLTRPDETQMENSERESEFESRENRGETGDEDDDEEDDDKKEMDVSAILDSASAGHDPTLHSNFPTNPARLSELGVDEMRISTRRREMGCSSFRVESSVKKKPVSIKRSISCGGRLLLPL